MTTTRPISESNFHVDFSKCIGSIKPLHGVNRGPIGWWGNEDHSEFFKAARFPLIRLHDCPLHMMDTVDIHLIFPNWDADERDLKNYRFAATDRYIQSALDTGAQIVYRLGESIEHYSVKTYIYPPEDYRKWTSICLNIIRHYNEGWADGYYHNIRYWEIWNEPDLTSKMWSGTPEQYYELYAVVSKAIKETFPDLMVGGPSLAMPNVNKPWPVNFLTYCQKNQLPMDFFSWHSYTCRPEDMVEQARNVRQALDQFGYVKTQSHLSEWNYLPFKDWYFLRSGTPNSAPAQSEHKVDLYKAKMAMDAVGSHEAAAFTATALIRLQDEPVDECMFYVGNSGRFGLFEMSGGVPRPTYHTFEALSKLVYTGKRFSCDASESAVCGLASMDPQKQEAYVMISRFDAGCYGDLVVDLDNLPWQTDTTCDLYVIDGRARYQLAESMRFKSGSCHFRYFVDPSCVLLCHLRSI